MRRAVCLLAFVAACKGGASTSVPEPVVEAGVAVGDGLCSYIEGVDDNGVVRTICAIVDEIPLIVSFITMLREADAGPRRIVRGLCEPLPGSTFCATSQERAKAILYLVRVRMARVSLDAGAP